MTSQAFLPLLRKAAAPIIVNMSTSRASVAHAPSNSFAYGLSKAALNMATRKMSMTTPGCAVVAVDPGWLRTDMGGPDTRLSRPKPQQRCWRCYVTRVSH
jgi:NAD(P)-dependent dehydrogenase (short-subunit alcohol dehydrogenase family)